jgi:hypothetical protein
MYRMNPVFALFVLAAAISLIPTPRSAVRAETRGVTPPKASASQTYYERQLAQTIELARAQKRALYFVFRSDDARCSAEAFLFFRANGVSLTLFDEWAKAERITETDPQQQTWRVDNRNCVADITIAKSVKKDGEWMRVQPVASAPTQRNETAAYSSSQVMPFFFEVGEAESCPQGASWGEWWHAFLFFSLAGSDLRGQAEPRESSAYERRFDFTHQNCRYEITVTMSVKTAERLLPLPALTIDEDGFK